MGHPPVILYALFVGSMLLDAGTYSPTKRPDVSRCLRLVKDMLAQQKQPAKITVIGLPGSHCTVKASSSARLV